MTTITLAYRMTLYAPRSTDPAEATILTPPAGAVHNNAFKITTLNNLTGWKPYLGFPRGRTGRVNMLERTTDVGTMSFDLFDAALVPGINANRWVSAFLGDANGDMRLSGIKCFVEESLDGGATWTAFWTGYVKALSLNGRGKYVLTVRDMMHELTKLPLFKQPPHTSITYAGRPLLLPLGITGASYGVTPATADLTGTISSPVVMFGTTLANVAFVGLAQNQAAGKMNNFTTSELMGAVAPNSYLLGAGRMGSLLPIMPNFTGTARAHLTWNAGANQGDFKVGGLQDFTDDKGHHAVVGFYVMLLDDATDLGYSALPANGTTVSLRIAADYKILGVSLFIDIANVLTFLADILSGKFSALYRSPEKLPPGKVFGDVRRSFANTVSSANAPDLPPARFRIDDGVDNALKWIQENILKPYGVALVCDGAGSFSVIDLRLPQSLAGLVTITDADIVPGDTPKWDHDRDAAIFRAEGSLWEDQPLIDRAHAGAISDTFPSIKDLLLKPIEHPLIALTIGSGDFGEKTWKMGGGGYRVMAGDAVIAGSDRVTYMQRRMFSQMKVIARPYAHGETTATLSCRRTALVAALIQGQVVQVNVSTLPNPGLGQRGGARICRIIEITRDQTKTNIKLLDLGIATVATAPTLGAPALGSDPLHTATITVTLSGTDPAEVRYAFTAAGAGAAPADNDPAWQAYPLNLVRTTGSITLTELTPGLKVWIQARTFCDDRASLKLPSVWTTSTGLTLNAYGVPSGVAITSITANSAKVGWTNGATMITEVWLRSPDSGAYTRVATLLPGSNFYTLWGLVASTAYGVLIQYRSWFGVASGSATASFSTTGSITILPRPPQPRRQLL